MVEIYDPQNLGFGLTLRTDGSAQGGGGRIGTVDGLIVMFLRTAAQLRGADMSRLLVIDHMFGVASPKNQWRKLF